jgi:hypothetical protein
MRSLKDKKAMLCESGENHKAIERPVFVGDSPDSLQIQVFVFQTLNPPSTWGGGIMAP